MFSKVTEAIRGTIGFRLTLWYAGVLVISLMVVMGIFIQTEEIERRDRDQIVEQLERFKRAYHRDGAEGLESLIDRVRDREEHEDLLVILRNKEGEILAKTIPEELEEFDLDRMVKEKITTSKKWLFVQGEDEDDLFEVVSLRLKDGALLQVGGATEERTERITRVYNTTAWLIIPILIIGLLGGAGLAFHALRPVRKFTATIENIVATGNLNDRLSVSHRRNELNNLGLLVNQMLGRIQTLIGGMKSSLDCVSHDLRTPLTRWKARAERVLHSQGSEEEIRDALATCVEEADHLNSLLNTLIDITEAEIGTLQLEKGPVEIGTLLDRVVDLYSHVAEDKEIQMGYSAETLAVYVDSNRLLQSLANLVDNSLKYTPPGGEINITAGLLANEVFISVADTGVGIAADEQEKIFERLYRCDRSRSDRGWGLGLSLVKAVIQAHGGRIEVESQLNKGSKFTIYLTRNLTDL